MDKKIEIPEGFTKADIQEVIDNWEALAKRVDTEKFPDVSNEEWEVSVDPCDNYIDRFTIIGRACFQVSTEPEDGVTYLNEDVALYDNEEINSLIDTYYISELKQMIEL